MSTLTSKLLSFDTKQRQALDSIFNEIANKYISKDVQSVTGDLIYASASRTPARLAIGSSNQILGISGGLPSWQASTYVTNSILTTRGDLLTRDASTSVRLAIGANTRILGSDGTDAAWKAQTFIDHGSISGLTDDDHSQYILTTGTRAFSGNVRIGSNYISNDGDNEGILIDTTGRVTQPTQPCFLVVNSSGATDVTGDNTDYAVTWPTEIYDVGGNFASNAFTAPVTGRYYLSASVQFENVLAGHTSKILQITTSNRRYRHIVNDSLARSTQSMHVCAIADMDAGDTAIVEVRVAGSTKTVDIAADGELVNFSGSLIN